MKVIYTILLSLFIFFSFTHNALSRPLVAEISSHDITIHSAFDGTELILFGVRNAPGDIIVVVRGPERTATIRKKEQVFGIWVNRQQEIFHNIPAFYALASSRNYEDISKSIYFDALQIGYQEAIYPFRMDTHDMMDEDERATKEIFARALLRQFRTQELYQYEAETVDFVGGGLFRTNIRFPDTTPTGTYTVELYLFSDGEVVGMHSTPIFVYKSGFDAFVFEMSQRSPYLYGLLAIALAIFGGLCAVKLFDRV